MKKTRCSKEDNSRRAIWKEYKFRKRKDGAPLMHLFEGSTAFHNPAPLGHIVGALRKTIHTAKVGKNVAARWQ